MTKRFIWDSKTRHGQIYDTLNKKHLHGSRETMHQLNNLWGMVVRFERENQRLIDENIRLKEKEEYCDNICKSFGDYYGMNIENAEWFGFNGDVDD